MKVNETWTPSQEIILNVMKLIDKPGKWVKGITTSADGKRHCLIGAFVAVDAKGVHDKTTEAGKAWHALRQVVDKDHYVDPVQFNDSYKTTHKDVMDALGRALLKLGEKPKKVKETV